MDPTSILKPYPSALLSTPEGRRAATSMDPALFALVYLKHHITSTDGSISFAKAHDDWSSLMKTLAVPQTRPRSWRNALVAPRATGKSTWWFLVAPLWAAAHNYSTFTAAFADTASQAETHLASLRYELEHNALLRQDYPGLTTPGPTDSRAMYISSNNYVFAARGADTSSLGLKVGAARPDLIILDDIEPGESNYSPYLAEKRLQTLLEVILPLNEFARVLAVGTVTMPESIIHQLTRGDEPWIIDENFQTYHHKALYTDASGELQSLWPAKWPLDFLLSIQHTRAFAKNYQNSPAAGDGDYWGPEDITYAPAPADKTRSVLTIDPAVTSKTTSDNTGIAILTFDNLQKRMVVRHCEGVRLSGRALRTKIEKLLKRFPEVRVLLIETNQGGDIWQEVFSGLPIRYRQTFSKDPKHVRAAELLEHYQRGRVVHETDMHDEDLLAELLSFPKVKHDDRIDAVAIGARYLAPLANQRLTFAVA